MNVASVRRSTAMLPIAMIVSMYSYSATADGVSGFYKDKSITIQVGYGVGGGYDTTARLFARHFGRFVPGNPTIVVANMPGAGGMRVANYIYNVAPKDGTVLGTTGANLMLEPLFGNKNAAYQADRFEWIGNLHSDINACAVWRGAGLGIRTLADLIKSPRLIVFGSPSAETESSTFPMFIRNVGKAPIRVVQGYEGTNAILLAMQRGEVDAVCGMYESTVKASYRADLEAGNLNIFFQAGLDRRAPLFGEATQVTELLTTDELRKIGEVVFRPTSITRPLMAPPGTPLDRVKVLREALLKTMKDPETIADAMKLKVEFSPMSGDEVTQIMKNIQATPRDLLVQAQQLTKP
jgi:tripartite-type tricarboxylate transporter receptor subunit TctC